MSKPSYKRPTRELKKTITVFCEGDIEYNYIKEIQLHQKELGLSICINPVDMGGGGYENFYKEVSKYRIISNCIAVFVFVDYDRITNGSDNIDDFKKLYNYCDERNKHGPVPYFLIVSNPNFEYVACLHSKKYRNGDITDFIEKEYKKKLDEFKASKSVYTLLNSNDNSYENVIDSLRCKNKEQRVVSNTYTKNSPDKSIKITNTSYNDCITCMTSNIDEFFDIAFNWKI